MSEEQSSPASSTGDHDAPGRLPPPAFPRGGARHRSASVAASPGPQPAPEAGVPEDAFISPDEPIVRGGNEISDDAFISPDAPIVRKSPPRTPEDFERVMRRHHEVVEPVPGEAAELGDDEVVVTGIGDASRVEVDPNLERHGDPAVADLVGRVGTLADTLRDKGEAGLRTTPDMTRFEATLRAYCVGYLAGLRRGD